ncbi:recombinase family protein [Sphingopyxis witflariensis]|uniref:Site-specific recombinase, DNA invertase Pin n=1 Tax=Sphingopyxis witflariensis TaxID=173675 RepID=A0A246JYH6_9SPHN|nr:recombinase family protein [Sphingopyxis witflariensis]OWQ98255.1 site-specific recombinase, DNA invertase Pin [Sphingopyxis witflariensis]
MLQLATSSGALTAPPKVYSYTRFSTPEQAQGDSHRRQTEAARKWAEAKGLILDERLRLNDLGVSAYRGANADADSGLGGFLHACREGLIAFGSYLLVESLDRISRMTPRRVQSIMNDIVDAGVTVVTLNDGQEYDAVRLDSDPTALMIGMMVSWRAHEESKTKGRRVAAAWQEKRRRVTAGEATSYTSMAPAWLFRSPEGWQLVPERADIVCRIYRDTIGGAGEHAIAQALNTEGVPVMGRGKMWHRSTVSKILRNVAVIGTLVPGRLDYGSGKKRRVMEEPVAGFYPAAISVVDWTAVRAIKDGSIARARGRSAGAAIQSMLAGLARCPECGAAMTRVYKGSRVKAGAPKLVCTKAKAGAAAHGYVSVSIDAVHDALSSGWRKFIDDVPAGDRQPELDREAYSVRGEISGTEDHLDELAALLDHTPSLTLSARVQAAEASLSALRSSLASIEQARAVADGGLVHSRLEALVEAFEVEEGEPLDFGKINAALGLLFSGITVDYRTGWLSFEWRQGGTTELIYAMMPA